MQPGGRSCHNTCERKVISGVIAARVSGSSRLLRRNSQLTWKFIQNSRKHRSSAPHASRCMRRGSLRGPKQQWQPGSILLGMTDMATIKVPRALRDRVRDAARDADLTQGQLIEQMLVQREKALFWERLEQEAPDQEYLDALEEADTAFTLDSEEAIQRFEADE